MSDEILDIAHGNLRLAAEIHEMLESLLDHENEKVREMARDVLNGASLRHMASSSVYGDEIGAEIDTFWKRYQEMTLEEAASHPYACTTSATAPPPTYATAAPT